jgi:hypothetical protein
VPDLLRLTYRAAARAQINAASNRLPRGWGQVLDGLAAIYLTRVQALTPIGAGAPGHKAGTLRASWKVRTEGRGITARRTLYTPQRYLKWVIQGRPAIDHRPPPESAAERAARRKRGEKRVFPQKRLHFWIGNREFYRWAVRAQAPNNFVPRARTQARREARGQYGPLVRRILVRSQAHHW